ncbi:MAG: cobaltochelatase subunit CobN, partial [Pseudomonadota bacterium]
MRDSVDHIAYRVVIVTLDHHAAGPAERALPALQRDFPGLEISIHAAATWAEDPSALEEAKLAVASANIIVANLLFLEEHVEAIAADIAARRPALDALVGVVADEKIVNMTRMGDLDMSAPSSTAMEMLKKLRPKKGTKASGESQMKMLRRLPKILKFIPGKAQDLRAYFLSMQYWLGGSDDNVREMIRFLVDRYSGARFAPIKAAAPVDYPDVALFHSDLPGLGITTDLAELPRVANPVATVGLLMLRSYVLASDTAHYAAVIRSFEAKGLRVIPAFAGGLDGRPAMEAYFDQIDALVSLTGFSLVGGPAYNDSDAAVASLKRLDVPYIAAHPLEFQTLEQWDASSQGLGPVETTMLIALPEIDGATNPTVFAGRHTPDPGRPHDRAMAPCGERVTVLTEKVARLATLRRKSNATKKVGIVLFGFPPNAGAVGTAAYLSVFESLQNTLQRLKAEGYDLDPPANVDDLRAAVLKGNAAQYGQDANVAAKVDADTIVRDTPHLDAIEEVWGPAPGKVQSDGRGVFVLGAQFGNVFVGVQPTFGYEGDPMRLLFEKGFAPTHAFAQFYLWLRNAFQADVLLHFGMHGALEFMPGKQAGLGRHDWPDRLIGELPNVYLYASNNPSEATLAKRRANAVTVTHITPPLATSGLYKGLSDLKDSLSRWRAMVDGTARDDMEALIADQAAAVDMAGAPEALWLKLLETEDALIPDGLHVVGRVPEETEVQEHLRHMANQDPDEMTRVRMHLRGDAEMTGLVRALSGRYIAPVPGGDLIRSPEVLPAGRNIHAFDPFRMPTAYALQDGWAQAQVLLDTQKTLPRSVALVLWGSDNIKSD